MPGRRHALYALEQLLGLHRYAIKRVDRRANGDLAIVLDRRGNPYRDPAPWPRQLGSRRTSRVPRRKAAGYRRRSLTARPRDMRARSRANEVRFAHWLAKFVGLEAPAVRDALRGDTSGISEIRELLPVAAGGDEWEQAA